MPDKRIRFSLTACALLILAACSASPPTPRVSVTVTNDKATFTSSEPLTVMHESVEHHATIIAYGDNGDYSLVVKIATPLRPGAYSHGASFVEGQHFNATIYACTDDRPGCGGLASSSDGTLTITRADDVVSGTFTVSLRGYDRSDYGEATVTFTVPPVQVVP